LFVSFIGTLVNHEVHLKTNFPEGVPAAVSKKDIPFVSSSVVGHPSFLSSTSPPLRSPTFCSCSERQVSPQTVPITPPKSKTTQQSRSIFPTAQPPSSILTVSSTMHSSVTNFLPVVHQRRCSVTRDNTNNAMHLQEKNKVSESYNGKQNFSQSSEDSLSDCDDGTKNGFTQFQNHEDVKSDDMPSLSYKNKELNEKKRHLNYKDKTLKRNHNFQIANDNDKIKRNRLSNSDSASSQSEFSSPSSGHTKSNTSEQYFDESQTYFFPSAKLSEKNCSQPVLLQDSGRLQPIYQLPVNVNFVQQSSSDNYNNISTSLTYSKSHKTNSMKKNNPWRPWSDNDGTT